jgi:hypothetical protein
VVTFTFLKSMIFSCPPLASRKRLGRLGLGLLGIAPQDEKVVLDGGENLVGSSPLIMLSLRIQNR